MAMGRQEQALLLAMNIIALAVLWPHVADTEFGQRITQHVKGMRDQVYSSLGWTGQGPTESCGLSPWEDYFIKSTRVVLPDGVQPATGEPGAPSSTLSPCHSGSMHLLQWQSKSTKTLPHGPASCLALPKLPPCSAHPQRQDIGGDSWRGG